jgi:predicted Ser/Thr protein kinase
MSPTAPYQPQVRLVLDRYRRGALIGSGGMGEVYAGLDVATGRPVAIKRVPQTEGNAPQRSRREVAALRVAQVPGVVELYDHGEEDGATWIVMALIEGRPFPDVARGDSAAIARAAVALLRILEQVHRLGIVHRDLKPSNVLVDEAGRVTVLDFGVARGEPLGATITAVDAVVGTPRYLAPEQALGQPVDARADLYAVGVMLYEAVSQQPMFEADSLVGLMTARVLRTAPPLADRAPEIPPWLADAIQRLVAREPGNRPSSAEAAIELFETRAALELPWLGDDDLVDEVVRRLQRGEGVRVRAARGMGSTRFASEVARRLPEGRALWARPGARPWASIRSVLEALPAEAGPAELRDALAERLREAHVLVVDDHRRLDRWSRRMVEALEGPVLLLGVEDAPFELFPLAEVALRRLFWGPSRVWHLPEDAAAVLRARTDGIPSQVARELGAWVVAGKGCWEGDRLRVSQADIEAIATSMSPPRLPDLRVSIEPVLATLIAWILLAGDAAHPAVLRRATGLPGWEFDAELAELVDQGLVEEESGVLRARCRPETPEPWSSDERAAAHLAIAEALDPGHPLRIFHFAAAGESIGLAREALARAQGGTHPGHRRALVGLAIARLNEATRTGSGPPTGVESLRRALAEAVAKAALDDGSGAALAVALRELARGGFGDAHALVRLVRGTELCIGGSAHAGAELVADLAPFTDVQLDAWRQLLPIRARLGSPDVDALIARAGHGADPSGHFSRRRREWLARARTLRGDVGAAAELHASVAAEETDPRRRLAASINAAINWRDAGKLELALDAFRSAVGLAEALRLPAMEAHARCGERVSRYRLPEILAPDPELVEAIVRVGEANLSGVALVTEAAVLWHAGEEAEARTCAEQAARAFGDGRTGRALALALLAAAGGPLGVIEDTRDNDELHAQVAALLCLGGHDALRESGLAAAARLPDPSGKRRSGVLSPAEIHEALSTGRLAALARRTKLGG